MIYSCHDQTLTISTAPAKLNKTTELVYNERNYYLADPVTRSSIFWWCEIQKRR
jgi:hypothetical protein